MKPRATKQGVRVFAIAAVLLGVAPAAAQEEGPAYDRVTGEISPGTQAPTREAMVNAIQSASPEALFSILEYGERVECHACVPLLQRQILESNEPRVREIAAWWLRRRPFGFAPVFREMRLVLANDSDPVRRARAAEAIGEFMDPNGVTHLLAAQVDADPRVREAVVRGLGRINSPAGHAGISQAFEDSDATVREAAIEQVRLVNFFRDHDGLMGLLADDTAQVRRRAALALGDFRVSEAVPALAAMLEGDPDLMVRQASAWALGRIGGTEARSALMTAQSAESVSRVRDAIEIALRMR